MARWLRDRQCRPLKESIVVAAERVHEVPSCLVHRDHICSSSKTWLAPEAEALAELQHSVEIGEKSLRINLDGTSHRLEHSWRQLAAAHGQEGVLDVVCREEVIGT